MIASHLSANSYVGIDKLSLSNNYKNIITKCHHRELVNICINYLKQHCNTNFINEFEYL